jgi:hypothetical protein
MIQPGRFTIISTTIDDGDVMKFELKVLDILRTYCKRPDGKYRPPTDLLALGPPDMPIESIEVTSNHDKSFKSISWAYPYTRLATEWSGVVRPHKGHLRCKSWEGPEEALYAKMRALIMNGIRSKELFDCKRGLSGVFMDEDDDAKAITGVVRPETYDGQHYRGICLRVTHEKPYSSE